MGSNEGQDQAVADALADEGASPQEDGKRESAAIMDRIFANDAATAELGETLRGVPSQIQEALGRLRAMGAKVTVVGTGSSDENDEAPRSHADPEIEGLFMLLASIQRESADLTGEINTTQLDVKRAWARREIEVFTAETEQLLSLYQSKIENFRRQLDAIASLGAGDQNLIAQVKTHTKIAQLRQKDNELGNRYQNLTREEEAVFTSLGTPKVGTVEYLRSMSRLAELDRQRVEIMGQLRSNAQAAIEAGKEHDKLAELTGLCQERFTK